MQPLDDLQHLTVFRGILNKQLLCSLPTGKDKAAYLLHGLLSDDTLTRSPEFAAARDPWEAWLIHQILIDENPWTRTLELGETPSPLLDALAKSDLGLLSASRPLLRNLLSTSPHAPLSRVMADKLRHASAHDSDISQPMKDARRAVAAHLAQSEDWTDTIDWLSDFYSQAKAGPLNLAYAFRVENEDFKPIFNPDPLRLEELTGYEKERNRVIDNTERLLNGLPAHNLLLYGDRGTGKSATIKSLIHRFGDRGLRMVEIVRSERGHLQRTFEYLGRRKAPTIIFFDDLSFEENETEYKDLKAILEGSLERMPQNVRIYATTNRRHLIMETFADRRGGAFGTAADEVHRQDSVQEKLSLSDRFGQTIIFPTPSQQAYLDIVFALAKRENIDMSEDELASAALKWAALQNGRSARTARQFIDTLID